ncbi:MAG TPA: PAS domain S-box protein, partial [Moraxellaceae bacterium]|nr:PAS domain S-box protein [Moraxellaceae bacterium]
MKQQDDKVARKTRPGVQAQSPQWDAARYRLILEIANEGVWCIDAESRTDYVNPKMAALLGYRVEEMLGRPMVDFLDPEIVVQANSNVERRRAGIAEEHESRLVHRDGTLLDVHMSTSPIQDEKGQYAGALAMVTDISARKRAEQALRVSEERFRALWEAAVDAIVVLDAKNRILYANTSLFGMFGYRSEELVGKDIAMLQPERLRERHRRALRNYLSTGHRLLDWRGTRVIGLHRDGREFPIEVSFSEIRIGGEIYFAGFIRDISERELMTRREKARTQVLQMIAADAPLRDVLHAIVASMEAQHTGTMCSVLLLDDDGVHVHAGAAPSLPVAYTNAIDGAPIGER